jgi:hypothetical protein
LKRPLSGGERHAEAKKAPPQPLFASTTTHVAAATSFLRWSGTSAAGNASSPISEGTAALAAAAAKPPPSTTMAEVPILQQQQIHNQNNLVKRESDGAWIVAAANNNNNDNSSHSCLDCDAQEGFFTVSLSTSLGGNYHDCSMRLKALPVSQLQSPDDYLSMVLSKRGMSTQRTRALHDGAAKGFCVTPTAKMVADYDLGLVQVRRTFVACLFVVYFYLCSYPPVLLLVIFLSFSGSFHGSFSFHFF